MLLEGVESNDETCVYHLYLASFILIALKLLDKAVIEMSQPYFE